MGHGLQRLVPRLPDQSPTFEQEMQVALQKMETIALFGRRACRPSKTAAAPSNNVT